MRIIKEILPQFLKNICDVYGDKLSVDDEPLSGRPIKLDDAVW